MKRLQIPLKLAYENFAYTKKIYVHDIAAVNLSKISFLKNKHLRFKSRLNNFSFKQILD